MAQEPDESVGLEVEQIRVYYNSSGEIVHIHKLVAPADQRLSEREIEDEMAAFAESVPQRHGTDLDYLVVPEEQLEAPGTSEIKLMVDVEGKRLVRGA
jgi:hypothetical protein